MTPSLAIGVDCATLKPFASRFALFAAVPMHSGATLLHYRVTLGRNTPSSRMVVPVVIDQTGAVEYAGGDGPLFVPPEAP